MILISIMAFTLAAQNSGEYREQTIGKMTFGWQVQGEDLFIRVSAPAAGYVAVGFEPTSMMKDADIYIGYVSGSTVVLEDHFAYKRTGHKSDVALGGTSNISSIKGNEAGGVTTIEFIRPLDSGDPYDKALVPGQEYNLIFAYSTRDNVTSVHRERYSAKVRL